MDVKNKILILEHDADDIALISYELEKSGINYQSKIVHNEEEFRTALKSFDPAIILSDYSLPSFDGPAAFEIKQNTKPEIPFIIVSGTVGEERAVELIKSGVTDYVLKDKLFSLTPKIIRALKEAEEKKEKIITDEKLYKANNLYAFISQVNQNIVRVKDEATLFRNSCHLAVEFGKFQMSWIGLFDFENKTISLVEHYGIVSEDLDLFNNTPYKVAGPQEYILRTGNYFICNDILNDIKLKGWKPFCLKRGTNSCLILPIKKSGKIIGTFNLYSAEYHFSNAEEIKLLLELTNDISFALDLFEKEKKQTETDELVLKNEKRFRALIEKSADMKTLSDRDGNFIYGSPAITKILGYTSEEVVKMNIFASIHPDDAAEFLEKRKDLLETFNKPFPIQMRLKHKNDNWIWCEGTITNMLNEPAVAALVSNFRNISERRETEKLREFEKNNFAALINNTTDLMWSVDRDFNLITCNIPFEEMSKLNFGRVIVPGESILTVSYSSEMEKHFKQIYERAFAGEAFTETSHFDIPFEFWSEISYYPIRKGDEIIGTACHSRDITQAKLAERKLKKSEAFNSGVLNSLSSHIAVVDASGTIIAVNDSWKRFSLKNGDATLLNTSEGADYFKVCEQATNTGIKEAMEAVEGIKEVMYGHKGFFYMEYPCHSPTEKRWFGMRVLKFDSDEPMVVVAHQNITERKLAEENLLQSEFRLNEAQAIAHLGNWEVNFLTNEVLWSEETCKIYGLTPEENIQTQATWTSFVHPEDAEYVHQASREAEKTGSDIILNHRILLRDGSIKHIHSKGKFKFSEGKPIGIYGIVLDVTERKLADEEREKMISNIIQHSKNLEQFASIVSHNLRAPVANILGLANVLKNNISKEDREKGQQFLFTATRNLDEIVTDLNKIVQVRSKISEYKEDVFFAELVTSIKSSIHDVIEKEMVQILTDFSAIDKITSIKSYLYSIFFNLISNGIKYRQEGKPPIIIIKSELGKNNIKISFKDNGIGIDLEKYRDQLFGLYKRFHLNIDGKGLGLFMVKTQIETLGGTIKIESKPNEGAEFTIELPL